LNLEKTKNITKIKDILEVNNAFKLEKISPEQMKTHLFRIRCYIFDINPEEIKYALKFLCLKCKKM